MIKDKKIITVEMFTASYYNLTRYGLTKSDIVGEIDGHTVYKDLFNRFYFIIHDPRND